MSQVKSLLDTPLSDNARIMLSILTDVVHADEDDNTDFDVLGPILQKHLQVSDEEMEALHELFKANFREWAMSQPNYEAGSLPKSLLPETEVTNASIEIYMTGEVVEVPINLLGISQRHLVRPMDHEHVEALIESDETEWEPIEFRLWPKDWAKLHPDVEFHVTCGNHRLMSANIKRMKTIRGRYVKADSVPEYMRVHLQDSVYQATLNKQVEQLFQQLEDILKFIKHPACEECESSNSMPWRIEDTPLSRWLCRSCYEDWTESK